MPQNATVADDGGDLSKTASNVGASVANRVQCRASGAGVVGKAGPL